MGLLWDIFCDVVDPMSFNASDIPTEKPAEKPKPREYWLNPNFQDTQVVRPGHHERPKDVRRGTYWIKVREVVS